MSRPSDRAIAQAFREWCETSGAWRAHKLADTWIDKRAREIDAAAPEGAQHRGHPVLARYHEECGYMHKWFTANHEGEDLPAHQAMTFSSIPPPRVTLNLLTLLDDMALAIRQLQEQGAPSSLGGENGVVTVEVSGLTGSGKSAVAGEIEILCKALGLEVEWVGGDDEKRLTHADWIEALELYNPRVKIVERNIPRAACAAGGAEG